MDLLILTTGGTFSKRYNPLSGALEVPQDLLSLASLCAKAFPGNPHIRLAGIISKDSLAFTDADRTRLCEAVETVPERTLVIIHGTDTMELSADWLQRRAVAKTVVLTGAMRPYEIDPVEATANLALACGFALADPATGVYLAMHGRVAPAGALTKDRRRGIFGPCAQSIERT